jgi:hypothetical protein
MKSSPDAALNFLLLQLNPLSHCSRVGPKTIFDGVTYQDARTQIGVKRFAYSPQYCWLDTVSMLPNLSFIQTPVGTHCQVESSNNPTIPAAMVVSQRPF